MKNILVTGGAGFLGSHLCEALLIKGARVFCLDNLFTGSYKNIQHLEKYDTFKFMCRDVISDDLENLEFTCFLDEIYNLACPASPVHYQSDPIRTMKTNVLGALNMLNLAKRTRAKILQTSTSEVYGDPLVHPQTESYWGHVNPNGIRSCYDEGKRAAETLFFDFHRMYQTRIKVARIFNTYGPKMHPEDGRVVSNLIVQAINKQPLTIYGDGSQTRSFCYVKDMVGGLMKLMDSRDDFIGPVNLGNPSEFTILELAQKVQAITKTTSEIIFKPLPSDDPKQRKPDISLAKEKLNWEPEVSLNMGLMYTIGFFLLTRLGSEVEKS
jgi:UDP-glucuronate decarboxylase